MLSALVYLQFQSVKNRLWERLRRLKNPRYLFGAFAGIIYFGMMLSGSFFRSMGQPLRRSTFGPEMWESAAALALFILLVVAWVLPRERAALVFTEAEIAFLFPAPIPRRTLIHYKLIRSQMGVLVTVFFLTLFTRWSGGLAGALMRVAGWWVLLTTINLHLLGASFARTILLEHGITLWRRRALVIGVLAAAVCGAIYWTGHTLPAFEPRYKSTFLAAAAYLSEVAHSPAVAWLLAPLRILVRPFLVSDHFHAFTLAIWPALGIMALHYLWVIRSDVAFEEASIGASQRHAAKLTALREGRGAYTRPHRRRRAPFRLAPTGFPAVAILWKNLLSAGQLFNVRLAIVLLAWATVAGVSTSTAAGRNAWPQVVGMISLFLAGWSFVLGPQFVRQDFRQDMAAADLLKVYPMRGWQLALGELLAPAMILTVLQSVLVALAATMLAGGSVAEGAIAWQKRLSWALSAMIVAPPLNLVTLLVPNAAAVLFPAWFAGQAGPAGSRGIEVVGGRLIFLLGQMIALVLALLPAGLVAFVMYTLVSSPYLGALTIFPATALVVAAVFAAEAAGGVLLLGHWFEKYDLSTERPT